MVIPCCVCSIEPAATVNRYLVATFVCDFCVQLEHEHILAMVRATYFLEIYDDFVCYYKVDVTAIYRRTRLNECSCHSMGDILTAIAFTFLNIDFKSKATKCTDKQTNKQMQPCTHTHLLTHAHTYNNNK